MSAMAAVSKLSWKVNNCFHLQVCDYLDYKVQLNHVQKAFKNSDINILLT